MGRAVDYVARALSDQGVSAAVLLAGTAPQTATLRGRPSARYLLSGTLYASLELEDFNDMPVVILVLSLV